MSRPALLERLVARPSPALPASVLGNLARLLAAHPGMAAAQPWLGVPVDPGSGQAGLERLRAAVAEAVRLGEPRLAAVRVEVESGPDGCARIRVEASAAGAQVAMALEPRGVALRPAGGG